MATNAICAGVGGGGRPSTRQLIMHELLIKVLNTPALRLVYWWKPGLNCQIQTNRVPLTAEQLFSVNNIVAR